MMFCWLIISFVLFVVPAVNCGQERIKPERKKTPSSSRSSKRRSSSSRSSKRRRRSSKSSKKSSKSSRSSSKKSQISAKSEKSRLSRRSRRVKIYPKNCTRPIEASSPPSGTHIRAEPQAIFFRSIGGLDQFTLLNDTNYCRAFKVKCTDNQLYRFTPVIGYIAPHAKMVIEVQRQNGTKKTDRIVVVSAIANDVAIPASEPNHLLAEVPDTLCHRTVIPLVVDA